MIEASVVRPSVKEQVESLGAKFIEVSYDTPEEKEAAVGVGGYAKPMPPSWLARQQVEVAKRVAQADIVISTALIPGRAAPVLITEDMVLFPFHFARLRHQAGGDDVIVHRHREAGVLGQHEFQKVEHVAGIECARVGGDEGPRGWSRRPA